MILGTINPEFGWDLLFQLYAYKSIGRDRISLRVLEELSDVIMRPLPTIFQRSWESGEASVDWKLTNIVLVVTVHSQHSFTREKPFYDKVFHLPDQAKQVS